MSKAVFTSRITEALKRKYIKKYSGCQIDSGSAKVIKK
jgi:hypothetical protein